MLIEFTFDRHLLLILIFPIFKQIDSIVKKIYIQKDNNLFKIFRMFLSYEFSIIFLIISKFINKTKKKIEEKEIIEPTKDLDSNPNNQIEIGYKSLKKKKMIRSILFLLLLSIINAGSYFYNYYVGDDSIKFSRNTIGIILEIIIYITLSFFILKQKFYKLHYFVSLIMIVSLIGLFINYSVQLEDKTDYYTIFWYFLIYTLLYGFFNVLLKLYLNIYFNSIYYILLVIGTIICFLLLLYDTFAYCFNEDLSGIIIGFQININNAKNFFLFLCDLILQFIFNIGIVLTIYYFTPFHFIISEFISELLKYYINLIEFYEFDKKENNDFIYSTNNIIIFSLVFFINLLCSLIFNEIIILKFFGLEYYTKKYINKRGSIETINILDFESDSNYGTEANNNCNNTLNNDD